MALIRKHITITIDGKTASVDEPIYFYVGDRDIDLVFTILDAKYKFYDTGGNILDGSTANYAIIKVLKPNGETVTTSKLPISNNQIVFNVNDEFADEITEKGIHQLQIQLCDVSSGKVTIPPISFEVLEPLFL